MIAGQVCFCREGVWDLRVEVGEDPCDRVRGLVADLLLIVDGDALEECVVEDAASELQPSTGADQIQHDFAGHVPAQEVPDVDTGDPDQAEHGRSPLLVIGDKEEKRLSSRSHPVVPPHPAVAKQVEAATTKVPPTSDERKGTCIGLCVSSGRNDPDAGESEGCLTNCR
ncbi:hypothetical protein [Microbacterium lacticum]|uniref:hypothetical protein n=1 Tax=Microbacterium lacticum TaxID=33885 RepID=UPI0018B0758C